MIKKMNVWQVKATAHTDVLGTGEYPDCQNNDEPVWMVFNAHFAERDRASEVCHFGCTNFPQFHWTLEGFYADDETQVDMQFDDLFNATGVTK
jgi:hypothetical protein